MSKKEPLSAKAANTTTAPASPTPLLNETQPPIAVAELYFRIQQLSETMTHSRAPFWNAETNQPNHMALSEVELELREALLRTWALKGYTIKAGTLAEWAIEKHELLKETGKISNCVTVIEEIYDLFRTAKPDAPSVPKGSGDQKPAPGKRKSEVEGIFIQITPETLASLNPGQNFFTIKTGDKV